jgi:hypothetical protein
MRAQTRRKAYEALPADARKLADKSFALLKGNPQHPSLRLKWIGDYWSARVGERYRALATEVDGLPSVLDRYA